MTKFNVRKINCIGDCVKTGESFLHPVTLNIVKNKNIDPICPSVMYLDKDNNIFEYKECKKSSNVNTKALQEFMALPYLNFDLEIILQIYKIDSIDTLFVWFNKSIESNKSYEYINRILNIWNLVNLDELKKNNKILVQLYLKYLKIYIKKIDFNHNKIEKDTTYFINKWFLNVDEKSFNFDLAKDLKKYLKKIYKI
uniref:Uncharacterized protein n=1 Tax=Megaviridae environmental sample TaxID=1737588 RepID=A0A5J6VJQ6_9VIRU|nr:MAG: hypothetical protein [Megaviridae environmental sample]